MSDVGYFLGLDWNAGIEKYLWKLLASKQISEVLQLNYRPLDQLTESGILVINNAKRILQFPSPLALRYFCRCYYQNRAENIQFQNLEDLAINSLNLMSAHLLQQSGAESYPFNEDLKGFPDEEIIQHLFMKNLSLLTTANFSVLPEFAKTVAFPNEPSVKVTQELDFFVCSENIKWGIELNILGRKLGSDTHRFGSNGKYAHLEYNDYISIDFRWGEPSNQVIKHENKVSVYFNSVDFKTCTCLVGLSSESIQLELSN
jgi:hypothetical protein